MLSALRELGIRYQLSDDKTECIVEGQGKPISGFKGIELFLGNAGTAMRPLTAALCLGDNDITLTGEPRMKERPIGHLTDALRRAAHRLISLRMTVIRRCGSAVVLPVAVSVWTVPYPASF